MQFFNRKYILFNGDTKTEVKDDIRIKSDA